VYAAVPGMPWAVAFVLGAVVSPTDPLAGIVTGILEDQDRSTGTLGEADLHEQSLA
jgi:hypothetical protein